LLCRYILTPHKRNWLAKTGAWRVPENSPGKRAGDGCPMRWPNQGGFGHCS